MQNISQIGLVVLEKKFDWFLPYMGIMAILNKKIVVRYKKIGYNTNDMRQTACLVVNPIKVNSFAYLFNCTTVGPTSD